MPYIPKPRRHHLRNNQYADEPGELAYLLAQVCDNYLSDKPERFRHLNEVIGALECVKQEVYRRVVAPFEDVKISLNGDAFACLPYGTE